MIVKQWGKTVVGQAVPDLQEESVKFPSPWGAAIFSSPWGEGAHGADEGSFSTFSQKGTPKSPHPNPLPEGEGTKI